MKHKTLEEQLYILGWIVLAFGCVGVFLYFELILPRWNFLPCMFQSFLGIYCPGCGGTRAVEALLQGQIIQSLWYHPLVLYTVVIFGGFMVSNTLAKIPGIQIKGWKFHAWYLFGALGIVVGNFILKNVLLLAFNITL